MNKETITRLWIDSGRIWITTSSGKSYSRPLEAFPILLEASDEERSKFTIGKDGDDIRWETLDEDIHISSFFDYVEPNPDNEIAAIFKRFPQLNVSEMARYIGINKSLLARYIYGIKRPSPERREQIISAIRTLGKEMAEI